MYSSLDLLSLDTLQSKQLQSILKDNGFTASYSRKELFINKIERLFKIAKNDIFEEFINSNDSTYIECDRTSISNLLIAGVVRGTFMFSDIAFTESIDDDHQKHIKDDLRNKGVSMLGFSVTSFDELLEKLCEGVYKYKVLVIDSNYRNIRKIIKVVKRYSNCKIISYKTSGDNNIKEELIVEKKEEKETMTTQSNGLSKRLTEMFQGGRRLNDDSCSSEGTLCDALTEIIPYVQSKCEALGAELLHTKSLSLYECQEYFHKVGGPPPNPENKHVSMKPDGGVFIMILKGKRIPILILEDKVQGTNDNLFEQNKKRQATGNAIERGAKNIRGAEMLFSELDIFPYVMFASGCDFHSCETIAKRIEMMNMGYPNHYIGVTPDTTSEKINSKIDEILPCINIKKVCGKGIASVFVKAHKWNEMKHGSSLWRKEEIVKICKYVIDKVFSVL